MTTLPTEDSPVEQGSPAEGSPAEGSSIKQLNPLIQVCTRLLHNAHEYPVDTLNKPNVSEFLESVSPCQFHDMFDYLGSLSDHAIMGFCIEGQNIATFNTMEYSSDALMPFLSGIVASCCKDIQPVAEQLWPKQKAPKVIQRLLVNGLRTLMLSQPVLEHRRYYLLQTIQRLLVSYDLVALQELSSADAAFLAQHIHLLRTDSNGDPDSPDAIVAVASHAATDLNYVQFVVSGNCARVSGPKLRYALYVCMDEITGLVVMHQPKITSKSHKPEFQEQNELSESIATAIDVATKQHSVSTMFVIGDMNTSRSPAPRREWTAEECEGQILDPNLVLEQHIGVDRCIIFTNNCPSKRQKL